jgi:hypothetical protein
MAEQAEFGTYDLDEGRSIFFRVRGQAAGHTFQHEREHALRALAAAVAAAAEAAGMPTQKKPEYFSFSPRHGMEVFLMFSGTDRLGVRIASFMDTGPRRVAWPDLDYDPEAKMFMGKGEDTYRVPTPGEPRKHRSAVAVVADVIRDELAKEGPAGT